MPDQLYAFTGQFLRDLPAAFLVMALAAVLFGDGKSVPRPVYNLLFVAIIIIGLIIH